MRDDLQDDVRRVTRISAVPLILDVVARTTGMGFAAVARVTEDRWVACAVNDAIDFGLRPGGELEIETTICHEIRQSGQPVVIEHAAEDTRFCGHPTPARYGFQSYISVPIRRRDGGFFGTLCAIDPRPAEIDRRETLAMFELFADLIAFHLDAQDEMVATQGALADATRTGELRDQFIAVLGHDLRTPLAALSTGVSTLSDLGLERPADQIVGLMGRSVDRMAGLVDDILDFARGQLGGGIPVERALVPDLRATLEQVVAELGQAWPDRIIDADVDVDAPVYCDRPRIAQVLSNLLGNALRHGDAARPVGVRARTSDGELVVSVTNEGPPITAEAREQLFQPFKRASGRSGQGLGLGLYIATEIARAHGGGLSLESTEEQTRFTLRIPARPG